MPRPKIPVEDRLEIQELFAYYAWGLNTGDADEVVACFTDDCEFEHLPQGIFRGHDQLRVLLNHLWYDKPGWFIGRQHLATHFVMTPLVRAGDARQGVLLDPAAQPRLPEQLRVRPRELGQRLYQGQRRVAVQVGAGRQVDGRRRAVGRGGAREDQRSVRAALL